VWELLGSLDGLGGEEFVGGPGTAPGRATLHQATWLDPSSLSHRVGLRLLSYLAEAWLGLRQLQAGCRGCQQQAIAHGGCCAATHFLC